MKKILTSLSVAASIFFFSCSEEEHFDVVSITDFEPKEGAIGILVTITGKNFDELGRNQVWFGSKTLGISAAIVHSSSSQLTVKVPEGALSDYIWVECYHPKYILKASSPEKFSVIETDDD
jgi:hypothetical protein